MKIDELFSWGIYHGPWLDTNEFQRIVEMLDSSLDTIAVYGGAENSLEPQHYTVDINCGNITSTQGIAVLADSVEQIENVFDIARCSVDFLIPRNDDYELPNYQNFMTVVHEVDKDKLGKAIKAMDYGDFLKTDYWRLLARGVREKQDNLCALCPEPCVDVHHADYLIHGYEHMYVSRLTALCRRCHEACLYRG